jgi:hypothetical protein
MNKVSLDTSSSLFIHKFHFAIENSSPHTHDMSGSQPSSSVLNNGSPDARDMKTVDSNAVKYKQIEVS